MYDKSNQQNMLLHHYMCLDILLIFFFGWATEGEDKGANSINCGPILPAVFFKTAFFGDQIPDVEKCRWGVLFLKGYDQW